MPPLEMIYNPNASTSASATAGASGCKDFTDSLKRYILRIQARLSYFGWQSARPPRVPSVSTSEELCLGFVHKTLRFINSEDGYLSPRQCYSYDSVEVLVFVQLAEALFRTMPCLTMYGIVVN